MLAEDNPQIMAMSDAPDYSMHNFATIPSTLVRKYGLHDKNSFFIVEQADEQGMIHRNFVTFDHHQNQDKQMKKSMETSKKKFTQSFRRKSASLLAMSRENKMSGALPKNSKQLQFSNSRNHESNTNA